MQDCTMAINGATRPLASPSRSRAARIHDIHIAACELVIDHGYDGFTMDDLARACGISRRTLFNYIPDKASAVLGSVAEHDMEALRGFRRGNPTGSLFADLIETFETIVDEDEIFELQTLGHHHLVEKAIASDPKVMAIATQRFEEAATLISDAVCDRQGWSRDDLRGRTLAARLLAIIKVTLEEVSRREERQDFITIFREVVAADNAVYTS